MVAAAAAALVAAAAQDDAGPAGCALEFGDAQSGASSPLGDEGGDLRLARAGQVKAGVDRVEPDQGVEQVQDRVAGCGHSWSARRRTGNWSRLMRTVRVIGGFLRY
jgi:hypothetical protein